MKQAKKVLALVLALAMVMAMGIMVSAAEIAGKTTGSAETTTETQADGTILVTLIGSGDFAKFDFGIAFDSNEVTVKDTKWNSDFSDKYADGIKAKNVNAGDYVVFGGTIDGSLELNKEPVGTVTLELKEGVTEVKTLSLIKDPSAIITAAEKEGTTVSSLADYAKTNADGNIVDVKASEEKPLVPEVPAASEEAPAASEEAPVASAEAPAASAAAPAASAEAPAASAAAGTNNTTTVKDAAVQNVIDLINAIGTVSKDNLAAAKAKIDAARAAYDKLTDAQKKLVTNYATLTAAEAKYKELTTTASAAATTKTPKTADTANVVFPVVAIVAAVAAVVVVSKKRVEE